MYDKILPKISKYHYYNVSIKIKIKRKIIFKHKILKINKIDNT